jgi:phage portal protein BeeE
VSTLIRRMLHRNNQTMTGLTVTDWAKMFRPGAQVSYQGNTYQGFTLGGYAPGSAYYESNSVVFSCESRRISVFSEARFQWQRLRDGRPGDLWGNGDLNVLEEPWPGATTRDLLVTAELDVAMAGNSYWVRDADDYLLRLDPANVKILTQSLADPMSGFGIGERLLGYAYMTGRDEITLFGPREIAHYKPIPSANRFLGQSWMTACLSDIDADAQITEHKRQSLRSGANLSYVVSLDASIDSAQFGAFVEKFREQHEGPENAGKTLFVGGGADVKTVGQTFENLALKATQGATETRIAACAGTHPVIVGLSEGMQGSALNAGNYASAKRNFVDGTMRPLWGAFAGAFQWLVNVPYDARLWYDDRDIAFLREDVTDQAEIVAREAQTIRQLVDAGFDADAVVDAVHAHDIQRLVGKHSGLFSVQLQPPQPNGPIAEDAPKSPASTNGATSPKRKSLIT